MPSPSNLRFTESHEWFSTQGDVVTITTIVTGLFASVLRKPAGAAIKPGGSIGEVESVKNTSDVYSAVGGSIAEVNKAVVEDPSLLNSDPYGKGWLVKIKSTDTSPLNKLMDQKTYDGKHPVGK